MTASPDKYSILVIEDNPGDFTLVKDFLHDHIINPSITHVVDFRSARRILTSQGCHFDIVLLDLSLPDRTGEPLIRELLVLCPTTPVVVLTGYADFSFGVKSLSFGIADYILKDQLDSLVLFKSIAYSIERKKSMLKLEESERRYSELFQLSPLPMWVFRRADFRFVEVNNAALYHYGYTMDEFLSMTIFDIRPCEEIPLVQEALARSSTSTHLNSHGIFTHCKKNGELINVEIQSNPVMYKGEAAQVVLATDITERIAYINTIETHNQKLHEIAWLQSHVVRAPLSRIMSLISLMKTPGITLTEEDGILDHILSSAHELDDVIHRITDETESSLSRM